MATIFTYKYDKMVAGAAPVSLCTFQNCFKSLTTRKLRIFPNDTRRKKAAVAGEKPGKFGTKLRGHCVKGFCLSSVFSWLPRMVMKALSLKYRESVGRSGENSQNRTKRNAFPKQENEEEKRQLFPET